MCQAVAGNILGGALDHPVRRPRTLAGRQCGMSSRAGSHPVVELRVQNEDGLLLVTQLSRCGRRLAAVPGARGPPLVQSELGRLWQRERAAHSRAQLVQRILARHWLSGHNRRRSVRIHPADLRRGGEDATDKKGVCVGRRRVGLGRAQSRGASRAVLARGGEGRAGGFRAAQLERRRSNRQGGKGVAVADETEAHAGGRAVRSALLPEPRPRSMAVRRLLLSPWLALRPRRDSNKARRARGDRQSGRRSAAVSRRGGTHLAARGMSHLDRAHRVVLGSAGL
mmetsp:Transcript_9315/g.30847  ORF Transcript_9315/g.30847 Transcript_9315/m.30847 type:complete len:282 (+) Transcript_9315:1744-2589(+)|eukprot:scaffold3942_cov123-Isochrysis_galbana.AAC.5